MPSARTGRSCRSTSAAPPRARLTTGQRIADTVAATMGSWKFIIVQSTILFFWITLNVTAWVQHWDIYPFILLNLALSFQAAYAAPFIMMSQHRQQDIDRPAAELDFQINIKAEREIEARHQKLDELRETEVLYLTRAVRELTELLNRSGLCAPPADEAAPPLGDGACPVSPLTVRPELVEGPFFLAT